MQIFSFISSPLLLSTLKRALPTFFCAVDKILRQLQLHHSLTGRPDAEVIVLLLLSLEILFASIRAAEMVIAPSAGRIRRKAWGLHEGRECK